MVAWFVLHNFWDLNIWLAGMSQKSFCKFITVNFVVAMAVPGLAFLPSKLLPWIFALLVALFPVTYLLEGQMRIKNVFQDREIGVMDEEEKKFMTLPAVEGARTFLLGLYAAIFMLIALEIKYELPPLLSRG